MRKDAGYIQRNFLKLQATIEDELNDMQTANAGPDGNLARDANHVDIEFPDAVPLIPSSNEILRIEEPDAPSTTRHGQDRLQQLEVPNELHKFPVLAAWQNLQSRTQVFQTAFISEPEKKALEQAYGVGLVFDGGQKVIIIGAPSSDIADKVKNNLTALLQDYLVRTLLRKT